MQFNLLSMESYHLHDLVALLSENERLKLKKGQVGTIVEILEKDNIFLVEFSNDKGEALCFVPLHKDDILLLHLNPIMAA